MTLDELFRLYTGPYCVLAVTLVYASVVLCGGFTLPKHLKRYSKVLWAMAIVPMICAVLMWVGLTYPSKLGIHRGLTIGVHAVGSVVIAADVGLLLISVLASVRPLRWLIIVLTLAVLFASVHAVVVAASYAAYNNRVQRGASIANVVAVGRWLEFATISIAVLLMMWAAVLFLIKRTRARRSRIDFRAMSTDKIAPGTFR